MIVVLDSNYKYTCSKVKLPKIRENPNKTLFYEIANKYTNVYHSFTLFKHLAFDLRLFHCFKDKTTNHQCLFCLIDHFYFYFLVKSSI